MSVNHLTKRKHFKKKGSMSICYLSRRGEMRGTYLKTDKLILNFYSNHFCIFFAAV